MAGNLGLLARLRLRHLRSDARFLLFAAGADIDEDRGFLERAYQFYLLVIAAVCLVLSWAQVIDLVEGVAAVLGPELSSFLASELLVLAPALAVLFWGVQGLRETPLRLAGPDMSLLGRVVRPEELFVVQLLGNVLAIATAGALGGTVLATLAGGPMPVWAVATALALVTARLFVLDTVLPRSSAERCRRRTVTIWSGAVVIVTGVGLVLASGYLAALVPMALNPGMLLLVCAVDLLLLAGAVNCAGRANMAFVIDDNELYAARRALRFLAFADSEAYKEACRRRRGRRGRQTRRTWRFRQGRGALVSHALVSLLRRPASLLRLLSWGALLVPAGALVMVARPGIGVLASWLFSSVMVLRSPLELGHVFREDCRNRLVRSLLPFGRLELLALDSLPALAVTLVASCAVSGACSVALGVDAASAVLLSCALDVLLALSCGLDDPATPVRLGTVLMTSFSFAALALVAVGLLSVLGAAPALVCALLLGVLLARALR